MLQFLTGRLARDPARLAGRQAEPGWPDVCPCVAVTSAVSISFGGRSPTATSTTLPVHCAIKPPDVGAGNVLW